MFRVTFIAALLLLISGVFSNISAQSEWQLHSEKNNVFIKTQKAACNDVANGIHKELILLKFENTNAYAVNVSFRKELWYNGKCLNCDNISEEHIINVSLKANEVLEGNCKSGKQLSIFSKMLNLKKSELTRFELKDISVTPVK